MLEQHLEPATLKVRRRLETTNPEDSQSRIFACGEFRDDNERG
jgi:hypothetical protein